MPEVWHSCQKEASSSCIFCFWRNELLFFTVSWLWPYFHCQSTGHRSEVLFKGLLARTHLLAMLKRVCWTLLHGEKHHLCFVKALFSIWNWKWQSSKFFKTVFTWAKTDNRHHILQNLQYCFMSNRTMHNGLAHTFTGRCKCWYSIPFSQWLQTTLLNTTHA